MSENNGNRLASAVRLPADEQREQLMVHAAKLYFDLDRNQSDIAAELGLTRWQVGRLLAEAKEVGIVRIEITPRASRVTTLEVGLQHKYGLRDAVVVPAGQTLDPALLMETVAQAAARYLAGINPKRDLIGVSWGRTMSAVARFLPPSWQPGVHIVLVNGATSLRSSSARTSGVAEDFAQSAGGTATLLPVPAILGKKSTRLALEDDPMIEHVLRLAEQANVACFGMGGMTHSSVLLNSGYLTEGDIDKLREAGAVGDVLGRFVDRDGNIVDRDLDERTMGLRLGALKTKSHAIGVVAGEEKWQIARAALTAGYVSVIVTDEATAGHALGDGNG
jgi:deoxyribonucleoside regulator